MIKLTSSSTQPLYLAPEHIVSVKPVQRVDRLYTLIATTATMAGHHHEYEVVEPCAEVVRLIMGYKQQLNWHLGSIMSGA